MKTIKKDCSRLDHRSLQRAMKKILAPLLLIYSTISNAQNNFPKEINLVFDYLVKKDYREGTRSG